MGIIAIIICILAILLFRLLPSKGKAGEKRVASILKRLPEDSYKVINDLLLSSNGYSTQIDHIIISIYGIFVIETKFYQGWIYGGENSEYWTQNIYGNKYRLRNPIHQNQGHIRALRFLLKDYGNIPFISIVAFSRQASLGIDAHSPVIYWDQIPRIINQFETRVLSESQIQSIYNLLLANNVEDKTAKKQHISNDRHNELKRDIAVANGYCPQCGGTLTLRQGKYGKFYGCSNYPRCKYTTHTDKNARKPSALSATTPMPEDFPLWAERNRKIDALRSRSDRQTSGRSKLATLGLPGRGVETAPLRSSIQSAPRPDAPHSGSSATLIPSLQGADSTLLCPTAPQGP